MLIIKGIWVLFLCRDAGAPGADFPAEQSACQRCRGWGELWCLLRRLRAWRWHIAAAVPGERQRSLTLLREFSWQGKACRAQNRASQGPGSASPVLGRVPPEPCSAESCLCSHVLLSTRALGGCPWHRGSLGWISACSVSARAIWRAEEHSREDVGLELPDRGGVWKADEGSAERCRAEEEGWGSHQVRECVTAGCELPLGKTFSLTERSMCECVIKERCRLQQCCPFCSDPDRSFHCTSSSSAIPLLLLSSPCRRGLSFWVNCQPSEMPRAVAPFLFSVGRRWFLDGRGLSRGVTQGYLTHLVAQKSHSVFQSGILYPLLCFMLPRCFLRWMSYREGWLEATWAARGLQGAVPEPGILDQFSSSATGHPGAQVWLIRIACCCCCFSNASH